MDKKIKSIIKEHAKGLANDGWIFGDLADTLEEDFEKFCSCGDCSPLELVSYWIEVWGKTEQFKIVHFDPLMDELVTLLYRGKDVSWEQIYTDLYEKYSLELTDILNEFWEAAFDILDKEKGVDIYAVAEKVIAEECNNKKTGYFRGNTIGRAKTGIWNSYQVENEIIRHLSEVKATIEDFQRVIQDGNVFIADTNHLRFLSLVLSKLADAIAYCQQDDCEYAEEILEKINW